MSNKNCELCPGVARMLCHSDQASLCWDCDAKVHAANFLVAKHSRTLLCHVCYRPTPWKAAGPNLGHTVSVCHACDNNDGENGKASTEDEEAGCDSQGSEENEEEDLSEEDDDGFSEEEEEEEEDEGENQVVPLSTESSSSNEEEDVSFSSSKRDREYHHHDNPYESEDEEGLFESNGRPLKMRRSSRLE